MGGRGGPITEEGKCLQYNRGRCGVGLNNREYLT